MKVHVDEAKCCGAGQCVLVAPEVFDQRDVDPAGGVAEAHRVRLSTFLGARLYGVQA
ncbi:hypothetical protein G4H13_10220 [Streptomyces rapamycinicus]|uniref:4Fe-4S ferredoxin-type domain-containing protein n=1 Tax=Streptomyces rhizosphaericus TaxID=114699 RepID=A0A6G4ABJ2_9ACTN|nr:hypothetical protein [Streptomyces rhizosphaericus]